MPTWLTSARNMLRSPAGVVGDPPDGPGAFLALRDDVDTYLGVSGAEYCANIAAIQAIPSGRKFPGKLAFAADTGWIYRYVGAGNTALAQAGGGQGASNQWQGWAKPPTAFSPSFASSPSGGVANPNIGLWGVSDGLLWVDASVVFTTAPTLSTAADSTLNLPSSAIANTGIGSGSWVGGGGQTSAGNQHELWAMPIGGFGQVSTSLRFRAKVAVATGATVKQQPFLGSYITPVANDYLVLSFRGPSGAVA